MPNTLSSVTETVAAVGAFVRDPDIDAFEALAIQAARLQHAASTPLQRLWTAQGGDIDELNSWQDIPALPTLAFKEPHSGPASAELVFVSSGTSGTPSRHLHSFLDLYRVVIEATFDREFSPSERPDMLALVPDRQAAPLSSLAFMVDHLVRSRGSDHSAWGWGERGLQLGVLRSWLGQSQRRGNPVMVVATTLSLIETLERLAKMSLRFRLPPGSLIVHTGGAKTSARAIDRSQLLTLVAEHLGLAPEAVRAEYGMTELTSHFYGRSPTAEADEVFAPPPWTRVRILEPATLNEVTVGTVGLISVLDLANLSSSIHVLTQDLGVAVDGGGFRLVGRAEGAELRGCSMLTEEVTNPERA